MSRVTRLLIKGLRSFSPNNTFIIEFYCPLTIILGRNGAGKTTIIECLKYACTGELPPNSDRGHSFVHDPKVAGIAEVKAQVKLEFRTVMGKVIVATRSMQLTMTSGKKPTFKALENVIYTKDASGERQSHSHRCADIDKEIPQLMGVSPAVLHSVIFCHQEDSNWPLGEPKALKARFDEIFSATRYVKALETIRKFRTELAGEIRSLKENLCHLEVFKNEAQKVRSDLNIERAKLARLETDGELLEREVAEATAAIEAAQKAVADTRRRSEELQEHRTKVAVLQNQITAAEEALEDNFSDPTEQLEKLLAEFETNLVRARANRTTRQQSYDATEKQNGELAQQTLKLRLEESHLANELEMLRSRVAERDGLLQTLAARYSDCVPRAGLEASAFISNLRARLDSTQAAAESRRKSLMAQENEAARNAETLRQKLVQLQASFAAKTAEKEKLTLTIRNTDFELQQHRMLEPLARQMRDNLADCERVLAQRRAEYQLDRLDRDIVSAREAIGQLSAKLGDLNEEMSRLSVDDESRLRFAMLKREVVKKEEAYKALLKEQSGAFERVLGAAWPIRDPIEISRELTRLERQLAVRCDSTRQDELKIRKEIAQREGVVTQLGTELRGLRAKYQALTDEFQKYVSQGTSVDRRMQVIERKISSKIKKVAALRSATQFYTSWVKQAQSEHVCGLCMRGLGADELAAFVATQTSRIEETPRVLEQEVLALSTLESGREKLRAEKPRWEEFVALQQNVPDREQRLAEEHSRLTQLGTQLEEVLAQHADQHLSQAQLAALQKEAETIVRLYTDYQSSLQTVVAEEARQAQNTSRTFADARSDYDRLRLQSEEQHKRLESLTKDRQSKQADLDDWQTKVTQAAQKHNDMQQKEHKRQKLEQTRTEAQASLSRLDVETEQCERAEIQPLQAGVASAEAKRAQAREQYTRATDEHQTQVQEMRSDLFQIDQLQAAVEKIQSEAKNSQLSQVRDKIQQCAAKIAANSEQLAAHKRGLAEIDSYERNQEKVKRGIQDNLRVRQLRAERDAVQRASAAAEAELRAAAGGEDPVAKLEQARQRQYDSDRKLSSIKGMRSVYQDNVVKMENRLLEKQYVNIDEQHRKMLITQKTTDMANDDLAKYFTALDKAMMKYHTMKMEEINKIVRELWAATYRGQDIDTIEIRSDCETQTTTRSYNYRVVMRRGDTVLDMRGRCSAGQKVLASLVIRLALAETFCVNCGILALDEPTTNLDRANIESFAQALNDIIRTRRARSANFQLIVITHDEEFVTLLGKRDNADVFYRVYKNESQHSTIERCNIAELD
eukprot:gnl/Spiro4/1263_TR677_c0_g1_i1.p1 gnl/Spiro4/1263_TR677_c0_g1~~gnl/Spiro4/1263_TR677_c0_g1_i1.p1  ORF type:complete len:1308 (-),score=450.09 gnl/Spiro4/1263_TR677_c0_g1_i1:309-4232(-)